MSAKARTLTKLLSSATTYSDRTAKNLTRSAVTNTSPFISAAQDVTLKHNIKVINAADSSSASSYLKPLQSNKSSSSKPLSELAVESIRIDTSASLSDSKRELSRQLNSILCDDSLDSKETCNNQPLVDLLEIPWLPSISRSTTSLRRREVSRGRKQKWVFKSTQGNRFGRLVRLSTHKLGADAAIEVFGKLGRETGVKEYNALIEVCIEKARNTDDEDAALEEFHRAYRIFETMREHGFEIGEDTYGPFLMFIIDMGMVEEFHFFCDNIKKENSKSLSRLAYYEMLLWIKVENDDKIQMLIANTPDNDQSNFNESYLVALCEGNRQEEVSMLLETIDIKRVSSKENMGRIFKSLGRLSLESHAKKFIEELKADDGQEGQDLSNLIYSYAMSIPNILIEDIVVKFKNLQAELKVASSSGSYEKLIKTCCGSLEVHLAIGLVEFMFEEGLNVGINTINSILTACYTSCEYNLVHRVKSIINDHNLNPNAETYRSMISLCVKMNDFDGAYGMIGDLERSNLIATANMYNAIMGGYFRQKNFHKGLMVLKQMDASNVKPDSHTFSYIIGNCNSEDDIIKYCRELEESGVQPTKHIFMALINAYAACGQFDKAKQVLSDKRINNSLNEIKSVLVSALATNGQIGDALEVYDEFKQVEANLEPKSAICLIEHLQSEGELSRLLQLLKQLQDTEFWHDGCARIILYCVRYKLLGPAVDLLKQRMEKSSTNHMATEVLFDEVFCEIAQMEPSDVQFGLDLLEGIKEEIGIRPSRKSLDFLLSACVNAKDLKRSFSVWKEYPTAGLPYNVLSYVRMYLALLASGAHKAAKTLLENIPDDDPHVCYVLKACQATFRGKKKKSKKKRK